MTMIIELASRNVYGVEKFYPSNSLARTMAKLQGQKTLTLSDIKLLIEHFIIKVDGIERAFKKVGDNEYSKFI